MKHEEAIAMLAAEKYVLGELRAEEREQFEEHYFTCPDCARDVEELDLLHRGTKALGASLPQRPASLAEKLAQWWARPQTGMAMAGAMAMLLVVVGYQGMELGQSGGEEAAALRSVVLRPETRGAVPEIPLEGRQVLLEVDLPGAQGKLEWWVAREDGQRVAVGQTMAPEPGQTLKLLLPARALGGSSQFVLEFRGGAAGESYRFRFAARKN